jgi:hypothetical protein
MVFAIVSKLIPLLDDKISKAYILDVKDERLARSSKSPPIASIRFFFFTDSSILNLND